MYSLGEVIEMRKRNALLLAAVSAFALMMTTATNAAYRCTWSEGVKVCGNEFGFAPSAGGESDRRDKHSGDHDSGSAGASGSAGSSGGAGDTGGNGGNRSGGGDGSNPGGHGNSDGSNNPGNN
jgi:hypothetical protein